MALPLPPSTRWASLQQMCDYGAQQAKDTGCTPLYQCFDIYEADEVETYCIATYPSLTFMVNWVAPQPGGHKVVFGHAVP